MAYTNPTVDDFKNFFTRNFPYSSDPTLGVTDTDIANAEIETQYQINQCLFEDQNSYNLGYLYLSAHNLVMNIRASSQGLSGQYDWLINSKAVGNVSEGISIPQRILDNPIYSMLSQTPYGVKYLGMILPFLSGVMFTVPGRTLP